MTMNPLLTNNELEIIEFLIDENSPMAAHTAAAMPSMWPRCWK